MPEKIAGPSRGSTRNLLISFPFRLRRRSASPSPTPTPTSIPAGPVLTKISLTPATASIHVGEEQTYVAQGLDQHNNTMTGITFTWTSLDDGANDNAIAIFHGGVATGVSPGVMHVTASASGVTSAPAALTVLAPPPALSATILVTPTQPSIFTGETSSSVPWARINMEMR